MTRTFPADNPIDRPTSSASRSSTNVVGVQVVDLFHAAGPERLQNCEQHLLQVGLHQGRAHGRRVRSLADERPTNEGPPPVTGAGRHERVLVDDECSTAEARE
jgi:hypothetical protein